MNKTNLSVIIPSYRNEALLIASLENNLKYLHGCEVIVVNDYPNQSLAGHLDKFKDQIVLLENEKNLGFGGAMNKGVTQASQPYLLFLNSDVFLQDDSFLSLTRLFQEDKNLFGITFSQVEKDGRIVGRNLWFFHQGMLHHRAHPQQISGTTAWAECGSCIIDHTKFKKLKGFDEIYSPFYWEDIDLSYRANQLGWYVYYTTQVQVFHQHESTTGKYFKNQLQQIALRNQFLFHWRNLHGLKLLLHIFWLPLQLTRLVKAYGLLGTLQSLVSAIKITLKEWVKG